MELTKENITTIAALIYAVASPFLLKLGLSFDNSAAVAFIGSILGFIFTIKSEKNPNTLEILGNAESGDDEDIA